MSSNDSSNDRTRTTDVGLPRVTAILVAHHGPELFGSALATIAAQRYPAFDLVVVDNASDERSRQILERHVAPQRLVRLPRNVGFGRAVAAALQNPACENADLLLLLHDDLLLAPDALGRLVAAMRQDPQLAVAGPKLRDWSDDGTLQEVGMTIDRFGRAESGLEAGELDQGQHDLQRSVLYVSTAGMLVRADVFRAAGGFDPRMPLFRDDLDLCWRVWLAGYRVQVVPFAVAYHIGASSRFERGRLRASDARYLAERHALASMLKNYSAARLALVLPTILALAAVKSLAFVATRRVGDALAVVRAYLWNLSQLPRTMRRRRFVQARRTKSDRELAWLFRPGLPRVRPYGEALAGWLAGGSTRALLDEPQDTGASAASGHVLRRAVHEHPAATAGLMLLGVYLAGVAGLLGGGPLVGGEVAPWPESARAFLQAYASPWNGEPAGSAAFPSPAQALLGLASYIGFGSAWLAQRVLVLGLVPLAWTLALRAARLVTPSSMPRILGATLYASSPVVLGALSQGRFGLLVAAALLPGLVLLATRTADPRSSPAVAWRSAALLALGLTTTIAVTPTGALSIVVAWLAVLAVTLLRRGWGRQPAIRVGTVGMAALLLLSPWLWGLAGSGTLPRPLRPDLDLPLWRALTATPPVLGGVEGLGGALTAAVVVGVVVVALVLGLGARPAAVSGLLGVAVASSVAAWGAAWVGVGWISPPALLLPAVAAHAALAVLAAHCATADLRQHSFGLRQIVVVAASLVVTAGIVAGLGRAASGPWQSLTRPSELLPAFVGADEERVGPYRVVLLEPRAGTVHWDVTGAGGPSMTTYGATQNQALLETIEGAIAAAVGGADPRAGASLGLVNVRYLVLTDTDESLLAALARQPALEPIPSGQGRVFRVESWVPRAVVLPPERGEAVLAGHGAGRTGPIEEQGLRPAQPGRYVGSPADERGGLLVVSEATDPRWRATVDGRELDRRDVSGVNAFAVPGQADRVTARVAGGAGHRLVVLLQLLMALIVLSLALRPPGFAQERIQRRIGGTLPPEVVVGDPQDDHGPLQVPVTDRQPREAVPGKAVPDHPGDGTSVPEPEVTQ
jgi:GT2 family glycosyltransferase